MNSNGNWDNCASGWGDTPSGSTETKSDTYLAKKRWDDNGNSNGSGKKPPRADPPQEGENPESNELFVRGLPYSASEDDVREVFTKIAKVKFVKLLKKEDGSSKGVGFIQFFSTDEAKAAMSDADGLKIEGRPVLLSFSKGKGGAPKGDSGGRGGFENSNQSYKKPRDDQPGSGKKESNPSRGSGAPARSKIFIANMSFKSSEDDLRNIFAKYGTVVDVKILMNDEGKSKGCCIMGFEEEGAASEALASNGEEVNGRKLKVEISTSRGGGDRGGRGGGDRGGRGGRGRGRGGFNN